MLLLPPEDRLLLEALSIQSVTYQGVKLMAQEWHQEQGLLLTVRLGGQEYALGLEQQSWQGWCELQLGTAELNRIDPNLLNELLAWGISPLLAVAGAQEAHSTIAPRLCGWVKQIGVTAEWQTEKHAFRGLLCGWPAAGLLAIITTATAPSLVQEEANFPVYFPLYAGWCELTLEQLRKVRVESGLRLSCFGDLREGEFMLRFSDDRVAKVRLNMEGKMQVDDLVKDVETLLYHERETREEEKALQVSLDDLPQRMMVEVGSVDLTFGSLRTLQVGDILPAKGSFSPEVTLRLNGKMVGQGVLVACGETFLVKVTQWLLASNTSGEKLINTVKT